MAKTTAKATGAGDVSVIGLVKEAIAAQNKLMAMLGEELTGGKVTRSGRGTVEPEALSWLSEHASEGSKTQRGNRRFVGTATMLPEELEVQFVVNASGQVYPILSGHPQVTVKSDKLVTVK